jgi:hypothetical protein
LYTYYYFFSRCGLSVKPRLVLNAWSSYFCLLSAIITDVHHGQLKFIF